MCVDEASVYVEAVAAYVFLIVHQIVIDVDQMLVKEEEGQGILVVGSIGKPVQQQIEDAIVKALIDTARQDLKKE